MDIVAEVGSAISDLVAKVAGGVFGFVADVSAGVSSLLADVLKNDLGTCGRSLGGVFDGLEALILVSTGSLDRRYTGLLSRLKDATFLVSHVRQLLRTVAQNDGRRNNGKPNC